MDQTQIERDLKAWVNARHQFSYESGILLEEARPGYARARLTVGENSINPGGFVHGGLLSTLADTAAGCCACTRGGDCLTAGSSMEFLRPGRGPWIDCAATARKIGRYLAVIEVELSDSTGTAVASGTFTFFMKQG